MRHLAAARCYRQLCRLPNQYSACSVSTHLDCQSRIDAYIGFPFRYPPRPQAQDPACALGIAGPGGATVDTALVQKVKTATGLEIFEA